MSSQPAARVVKVCHTCGRFRRYDAEDSYCVACGYDSLTERCGCGRSFDYALDEPDGQGLHCPRCGKDWRGAREQ